MASPLRVLSLDGGGIRGIIPALVLSAIEAELKQPIAASFDLVAGTSTGGILALGLTVPGDDGKPRYRAADLAKMYEEEGPTIFHASLWQKLARMGNLNGPKYTADGIETVLHKYFGDTRLKQALTEVLITSYEIDKLLDPFFFRSARAQTDSLYDFYMRDVARATSAAPTYFEPARLESQPGDARSFYGLVDGGVFANNPAMCAYAEVRSRDAERELVLVSVGTGQAHQTIGYAAARSWGLIGWAPRVLDVVFDGVSDTVDYQLAQVLPAASGKVSYFRLQCALDRNTEAMDDVSPANLARLRATGEKLVADQQAAITALCAELKAAAPPAVPA
jgi:patatin-like phospholipase/acyl hydrolase